MRGRERAPEGRAGHPPDLPSAGCPTLPPTWEPLPVVSAGRAVGVGASALTPPRRSRPAGGPRHLRSPASACALARAGLPRSLTQANCLKQNLASEMSGITGRGRRWRKGIKNKRPLAEATTDGAASGLPGRPGSLTDPGLEGHHLARQLLQPAGPQVAAVMRTP